MTKEEFAECLNPCFNGRYSQSAISDSIKEEIESLNPCFNGRYSQRDNAADFADYLRLS